MSNEIKKHTICLYVNNAPGVLIRISLCFARRGYNIDSLVVSEAFNPQFSHMNIVVSGETRGLSQILKQLNKIVDVVHAVDSTGQNIVERELALIKVKCTPETRSDILQLGHALNCNTVNLNDETVVFEVMGKTEKLDDCHKIFAPYGVEEMVRSGKVLLAKKTIEK